MVMGLTNTSADEPLAGVHVDVTSPKEGDKRSYLLKKKLPPGDSISVGWMELDGWKLKRGDKVAVRCKGYAYPIEDEVPQR
jgi:hypothetical protein